MTENKQIEEMAKVLCGMKSGCNGCIFKSENCFEHQDAEALYAKSYRKASEVARGIFEEIEEALFDNHCVDDGTDFPTPHYFEELKDDIAELKKKYTEVTNNDGE